MSKLSQFNVAIIEPTARQPQEVAALQRRGTQVIAYISVMEAGCFHPVWPFLREEDFLHRGKERIPQLGYDTFLLNLQSVRWRNLLIHSIGRLFQDGYDGIFLDTIGDVEIDNLPQQMHQIEAAAQLVKDLRRLFPERIIIQNNGLEILCLQTAPHIDGIVWENPPVTVPASADWVDLMAHRLLDLARKYPLKPMILYEMENMDQHRDWVSRRQFADQYQFPVYFSSRHYVRDVNMKLE